MPRKKKVEEPAAFSNVNNNTNNNNIHVNVKVPRAPRKTIKKQEKKPHWIVKAVVVAIVGLVISGLGYIVKVTVFPGKNKPPVINTLPLSGHKES